MRRSVKRTKISRPKLPKTQRQIRLALIALFIIGFLVVLGKFLAFLSISQKPITPQKGIIHANWNGVSPINIVLKAKHTYLLSLNPQDKTFISSLIPDETYLNLPLGFGSYPIRSVYTLGEAETPPLGGRLLRLSLEQSAGVIVNGYIQNLGKYQNLTDQELLNSLSLNPFNLLDYLKQVKSDLSLMVLYKFFWEVKSLKSTDSEFINLGQSNITSSILLPDKTRALTLDGVKFDLFVQKNLADKKLADEGLSIGIYNGTDHPKLGEMVGRLITNLGGRVIFISNTQQKYPQTLVFGNNSYTRQTLTSLFSPSCWKNKKCDKLLSEELGSRSQVTIVLGEEYYFANFEKNLP